MSQPGWAGWLSAQQAQRPAQTVAQALTARAEVEKQLDAAADLEAELAAADTADKRAMAFRAAGLTAGHTMSEALTEASRVGDEDAQLEAARALVAKLERRQQKRAEAQRDQMERLAIARSAAPTEVDLLRPAKEALAAVRVERMLAAAATEAPRARRPKDLSRSRGGEAVRSHLECVYCLQENVDAETSALLHHDPDWGVPVTTEAQMKAAEQAAQQWERPVQAERRQYAGPWREISR